MVVDLKNIIFILCGFRVVGNTIAVGLKKYNKVPFVIRCITFIYFWMSYSKHVRKTVLLLTKQLHMYWSHKIFKVYNALWLFPLLPLISIFEYVGDLYIKWCCNRYRSDTGVKRVQKKLGRRNEQSQAIAPHPNLTVKNLRHNQIWVASCFLHNNWLAYWFQLEEISRLRLSTRILWRLLSVRSNYSFPVRSRVGVKFLLRSSLEWVRLLTQRSRQTWYTVRPVSFTLSTG